MTTTIFIQGIMARSGTNYLNGLLQLHPDCTGAPLYENYLLHHAHWLSRYIGGLTRSWDPAWGVAITPADLFADFGRLLLERLCAGASRPWVVTKTPSVENLPLFFDLFPSSRLLILVRDGRDVVESSVRSFPGWTYEHAMRRWAAAARTIIEFERQQQPRGCPYLLVRYEDLYQHTAAVMQRVLAFSGLDPGHYDFDRAASLPVRGSSDLRASEGALHWRPVERTASFQPLQRWQSWPRARHERFNWLAGPYMRAFNYELQPSRGWQLPWRVWNRFCDARWQAARRWRRP